MPSKFSLGGFLAAMEAGYEPQAPRSFTAKDFHTIANSACESFRISNLDLLSCFELEGEFGLWSTIQNFVESKKTAADEINAAAQSGNETTLGRAFQRAMKLAFIALYEKGALKRLQLVDQLPDEALRDLRVLQTTTAPPRPARPAPVVLVASVETPEDQCTREFAELPSSAWKAKWLSNQNNRAVADRCAAEGRL